MADMPDDSPSGEKPPRSSKPAPPFFGPRHRDSGEVSEARQRQRRSSPLFVPPGSLPPEEKEAAPTESATEAAAPDAAAVTEAKPFVERRTPIERRAGFEPAEEVAPADPAPAEAAPLDAPPPTSGARLADLIPTAAEETSDPPTTDGLLHGVDGKPPLRLSGYFEIEKLETPEIQLKAESDRPAIGGSELQVISYGDANTELESNTPPDGRPSFDGIEFESTELTIEPSKGKGHAPSDLNVESFWATDAFALTPRPTREVPRAVPPLRPQPPVEPPPVDRAPVEAAPVEAAPVEAAPEANAALDALRVEEVMPPRSPTPPSMRAVTPRNVTPATALPAAPRTPAALEALKELEPWTVSAMERPDVAAAVADALERVARRIRNGEVRVRTDVTAPNEESALSAALQALSRSPRP